MTRRRLLPYAIVIIVFLFIYWLTMMISNKIQLRVPGSGWPENMRYNKLTLQREIFVYGLGLTLVIINLLEIITTADSKFLLRLFKSVATIIIICIAGRGVYWLIGAPREPNLYYYYRGAPAGLIAVLCMAYTVITLIVLELMQLVFLALIPRTKIVHYIPDWLRLEKQPST